MLLLFFVPLQLCVKYAEATTIHRNTMPYRVLLYYKYVTIDDPAAFVREHKKLCASLDLRGRIMVAAEGINGTVSGTTEQAAAYITALRDDPRFSDMEFKIDEAEDHAFRKMVIKSRPEIVRLRLPIDVDPLQKTGRRLKPAEFFEAMQRDDVVVVDARNDYEYNVGHFRGAIQPTVKNFRDFPQWVRETLDEYRDKTILTYCTGGIRCEKFSAMLMEEGFNDVCQLEGGIVTYGKDPDVQGRLFEGSCYVFDERVTVPVNRTPEATVISHCYFCGGESERYVNCANLDCDKQFLCCVPCEIEHRRSCSPQCAVAGNHEFDPATAGTIKSYYR